MLPFAALLLLHPQRDRHRARGADGGLVAGERTAPGARGPEAGPRRDHREPVRRDARGLPPFREKGKKCARPTTPPSIEYVAVMAGPSVAACHYVHFC